MWSESQPAQEALVAREPGREEAPSGGEPRPQRPGSAARVQVKEEVVEYLKEEREREDSAALYGVSETPALVEPYAGHEVKDELVLGPERLQPADIAFTLYAAQALNVKKRVPRDCAVRPERVARLESNIHSNTNIATDRYTYVCDVGNLKTAEMETAGEQTASVSLQVYSVTNEDVGEIPGVKHSKTANITKETTPYKCNRCSYASAHKSILLVHERKHTGEKPYKCSHCSYASARKSNLLRHERKHTGERPYKCKRCSYASANKHNVLVHERKHIGEKLYKCGHCSYASADKSDLVVHERRKHTGEQPYKCKRCSYASAHKNNLLRHERKHTGEKPYKCNHCSYIGANKHNVLVHERKHTGEKPYKCSRCSYASAHKHNVLVHERKHTGEKPYKCSRCSFASARKDQLFVHERKHTGEKPVKTEAQSRN